MTASDDASLARVVFMGSDRFSVPILQALLSESRESVPLAAVVGVVTQPDRPAGRGRRMVASLVKELALEHDVPVLQPERLRALDQLDPILQLRPDLIVVASYGLIIPRTLLDAPPAGSLNLHPSLLPAYRGPSPIAAPILNGDAVTGTTLMLLSSRMDAGPIIDQVSTAIDEGETRGELESRLAAMSAELLIRDLPRWLKGELSPQPQDDTLATYTTKVSKEDGLVDWSLPAEKIARRIRAYNPWPVAHTIWNGKQLRLWTGTSAAGTGAPGHVLGVEGGSIAIGTIDGILLVNSLQLPGGRIVSAQDAVRGHRQLLGARLGE